MERKIDLQAVQETAKRVKAASALLEVLHGPMIQRHHVAPRVGFRYSDRYDRLRQSHKKPL